jgi:hypothetical protein
MLAVTAIYRVLWYFFKDMFCKEYNYAHQSKLTMKLGFLVPKVSFLNTFFKNPIGSNFHVILCKNIGRDLCE